MNQYEIRTPMGIIASTLPNGQYHVVKFWGIEDARQFCINYLDQSFGPFEIVQSEILCVID